ncbi:delta-aminolevulinic acid dehydratase [cyanobacterium TDX16]|nr:delta-aminolevulinic acid dehydratase [cyanobacterium TDX16]
MSDQPIHRFRRLRNKPAMRDMVRETTLSMNDFVYPMFIAERSQDAGPVTSMPGVVRHSLDDLDREIEQIASRQIRSVLLFGIPAMKDDRGSGAYRQDGIIPRAVDRIKELREDLIVIADVCLCEYTDHGHCGIVHGEQIKNDETLELLASAAIAYAEAGADVVAPSAMMDGQVSAIRTALDRSGHDDTAILSYAVKYASALYGPFRDAAACAPKFGDRRSHQMDPANIREALAEAEADAAEGADMLMVKPAGAYLDVIAAVKERLPHLPLAAYQVSGEYSMIKAAAANGWIDERRVVLETLTAIKRAGADIVISYFAKDVADYLADR